MAAGGWKQERERMRKFFFGPGRAVNIALFCAAGFPWVALPALFLSVLYVPGPQPPYDASSVRRQQHERLRELARQGDKEELRRLLPRRRGSLGPGEENHLQALAHFSARLSQERQEQVMAEAMRHPEARARSLASARERGNLLAGKREESPRQEVAFQKAVAELLVLDPENEWALARKAELGRKR